MLKLVLLPPTEQLIQEPPRASPFSLGVLSLYHCIAVSIQTPASSDTTLLHFQMTRQTSLSLSWPWSRRAIFVHYPLQFEF
mmetsp:Transcript_121101/g.235725  ORF Transcript_121101/g.235725 Transcript_121101/m.235725 type:complete len:81 (-) Transcript_121101:2344-2586(-)